VNILALDTTSEHGSVAIRSGGVTVADIPVHAPDGFAHILFPAIEQALTAAGLRLNDIDCFAGASGPGSFTGVRVGLSAVKGLAEAAGKKAAGVSNLRALALFGHASLRAPVLDARRGQAYVAVYDAKLKLVVDEAVVDLAEWKQNLGLDVEFITSVPHNLASAVAQIAEWETWSDPAALDANYVRRSDAELFWRDDR